MTDDRTRWSDERIDDSMSQIWRAIDDLPNRMTKREASDAAVAAWMERMEGSVDALRFDFNQSRQGMSRPEKIALFSAVVAFLGVLLAVTVQLVGA